MARICRHKDCKTVLNSYNKSSLCYLHISQKAMKELKKPYCKGKRYEREAVAV